MERTTRVQNDTKNITINIEKYSKPIIWLDTNFVVTMAKNPDARAAKLLNFLEEKQGEYFVIQGDKTELLLGNHKSADCTRLLARLSSGVAFLPYETIEQFQFQAAAKAVITGKSSLTLEAKSYIRGDPIREFEDAKKRGFVVDANFKHGHFIDMETNNKREIFEELVACQPKGVTVSDQQGFETLAPSKIAKSCIKKLAERMADSHLSPNELSKNFQATSEFQYFSERLQWWHHIGGAKADMIEVIKFLESQPFIELPFNYISSQLFGAIFAGDGKGKLVASDPWDIKHIRAIFPFCNILFTDERLRRRLIDYGLAEKYQVEVYCLKNIEDFFKKHK